MKTLLYIKGSPRSQRSVSTRGAETFLAKYRERFPENAILEIDLWHDKLPEFNEDAVNARYKVFHDVAMTSAEKAAWDAVANFIQEFATADEYLFSVPMWNFSLPYRVKQFIDVIVQPHLTFEVTDKGYNGLLKDKKAYIVFSSGGDYQTPDTAPYDHCRPYFRGFLNFIGITDLTEIDVHGTMLGVDSDTVIQDAVKKISL